MQPILLAKDITKSFGGAKALENARLELYPGEIQALVGENGAGKSTIIKILAGVYVRDSGTILFDGKEIEENSIEYAKRLGLAVIYRELSVVKSLTAVENIFLGSELMTRFNTLDNATMTEQAKNLLSMLGITSIPLDEPVSSLSVR